MDRGARWAKGPWGSQKELGLSDQIFLVILEDLVSRSLISAKTFFCMFTFTGSVELNVSPTPSPVYMLKLNLMMIAHSGDRASLWEVIKLR